MSEEFYIQASNPDAIQQDSVATVNGLAVVCGQETLTLKDAINPVFSIFVA